MNSRGYAVNVMGLVIVSENMDGNNVSNRRDMAKVVFMPK